MDNSPYLDKPFVPLAVALRSMLAETEAKIAAAPQAEQARLQERADVLREWLGPKPTMPLSPSSSLSKRNHRADSPPPISTAPSPLRRYSRSPAPSSI